MHNLFEKIRKSGWVFLILMAFFYECDAINYYSRQSGLWSVNTSWSTVGYGSAINTGTYPRKGDVVFIGDGHNISMNVNSVTASITVGQGSSGSLLYSNYLTFLMVVAGNLTVNSGATFGYASNSSRMHNLFISGSIINNGTFDVYYDANDFVNITFNSAINTTISGAGTWDLNKVSLVKSNLTSYYLDATINSFEVAIKELVVTYGTFIHNNSGTYLVNPTIGNFTVPLNAIMKVQSGILHLAPNTDYVFLEGELNIASGTMRIGRIKGLQGIRYKSNPTKVPVIDISGGLLQVYGGITYRSGYATDPLRFNQTGGSLLLNCGWPGSNLELFKINNSASSRFAMSGGIITLQKPNNSAGLISDFDLCGSAGTITFSDGTVEFGNNATSNGSTFNFTPYAGVVQPNFKVTGSPASSVTLKTSNGSTSDFILHSLYIDVNKIFDIRSITGTAGDTKNMTLSSNYDGLNTLYNDGSFVARNGTVTFQGIEGLWINGSNTTTFYNLNIDNGFGVALARNINISNQLLLLVGVLYSTPGSQVTALAGATSNLGSSISYVDGPFEQIVASSSAQTLNLPIGKNGSFRPIILAVLHSDATSITYTSEVWNSSARAMSFALPPSLTHVSDIRYFNLNRSAVANLSNARITLTYGADDMVTDPNNLRVARDNGSSSWLDLGGVGTAAGTGSITSNNFVGFNTYFTLANALGGINPLPVEYFSFDAKAKSNHVEVIWSTASEVNSDYFIVEKSTNGTSFNPIGKVNAAGHSTALLTYLFNDAFPSQGNNYYRLKQVDRNGTFEYSQVRVVNFKKSAMNVYPNPVTSRIISVSMDNSEDENLEARLMDLNGKIVAYTNMRFSNSSDAQFTFDATLSPGVYLFELMNAAGNKWHERIVLTQ
ncbi:MAG: T9SS type A sorting domain-containing protein [Bacteroidetes bacterium]|nr:T9SS type A sorting domain-containing protein [Bacteroidota bacterium]